MEETKKCCICKKKFIGWGNNAWPIKNDGICCNECNGKYVLAARFEVMYGKKD